MKVIALSLALHLAGQVCETEPARCEAVIRKQSVAIDALALRLDESTTLLEIEKSKNESLTAQARHPTVIEHIPWWAYVLTIAGTVALGTGIGLAASK